MNIQGQAYSLSNVYTGANSGGGDEDLQRKILREGKEGIFFFR